MPKKFLLLLLLAVFIYLSFHQNGQDNEITYEQSPTTETTENPPSVDKLKLPSFPPSKVIRFKIVKNSSSREEEQIFTSFEDFKAINQVPQDEEGNIYITDLLVDEKHLIAHGDIIVGNIKDLHKYKDNKEPLVIPTPSFWPDGVIPFTFEDGLPQKGIIQNILKSLSSFTKLRFIKRGDEINYIKFKKGPRNCYSHVGMIGGEQTVSLSERCRKKEILHEIMHSIGFFHEQNRMDRDEYVQILWENIAEEHWPQFQKIKTDLWEKYNFPFSFDSILLYPPRAFSQHPRDYSIVTTEGSPFSPPNNLSRTDINRINTIYSR